MSEETLLPHIQHKVLSSSIHAPLCSVPEQDDGPPPPLTPSELKKQLIFGPSSPRDCSSCVTDSGLLSLDSPVPCSSDFAVSQELNRQQWRPEKQFLLPDSKFRGGKSNLHRCKTAPAMPTISYLNRPSLPKPRFSSQSNVQQAFLLLLVYLTLGVTIYWLNRGSFSANETHPVVDAIYFCIVTMCTIGYGDITPNSTLTKIFSILFVLVGFGFIDILLSGMVSNVLDLQEGYLLRTVKGRGDHDNTGSYFIDVKKGRMRIRMKVALALGVVVICIAAGACFMHFVECLGWLDSFYLSVMSVTTVGYGDKAFDSMTGRIFASVWLLVSTIAVARAFLYLAEARVAKRHQSMARWVLRQDMTVSQFLDADIDNNGFVSKSEYVIYKLKEMGKVFQKDITPICHQFDRLDTSNFGKISLADLVNNTHLS